MRRLLLILPAAALVVLGAGCSPAAKSARHLARAEKDFAAGNYDKAEIEYITAIRAVPTNAAAFTGAGILYYNEGRLPQAVGYLARAIELNGADANARIKLGMLNASGGQFDKGRQHALEVLKKEPHNLDALLLLANCTRTAPEQQECLKLLDALPAKEKASATAQLARGTVLFNSGQMDAAEAAFKQATRVEPKSDKAHQAMFALLNARNRPEEAEKELALADQVGPLRSPAHIQLAELLMRKGNVEEAKRIATGLTQKAPDYVPAWSFLAQTAFSERKLDEAMRIINTMLARDPSNYEALTLRGKLLIAQGKPAEAIKTFDWIVQAYGGSAEHYKNLAMAQVENKQENQAVVTLDKALAASTNNVELVLLRAALLVKQGSFDPAIASLLTCIDAAPRMPPLQQARIPQVFALLARAQAGARNISEAVSTYDRMRRTFPKVPEVQLEAANGFSSLNQKDLAKAAYLDYVSQSTNSFGLLLAANGLAKLKEIPSARQILEKLRKTDPGFLPALEALTQLDMAEQRFPDALQRVQAEIATNTNSPLPYALLANVHIEHAAALARKAAPGAADPSLSKTPGTEPDLKSAETALLKALEIQPDYISGYNMLARVWVDENRQKEAADRLLTITSKTNHLVSFVQLALIYEREKNYQAAADVYEKALLFAPNSLEALNNLATLYTIQLPRLDRALELATSARRFAPNVPAVMDTLGWVYYNRGDYQQAFALIEEAFRSLPSEPEVEYHLGMTCYMLGREQQAAAALEHALSSPREFTGKTEIPGALSVLAVSQSNPDTSALATLEKRVAEKPNDVMALSRLAAVHERQGAYDKAAERLEQVLKVSPNNTQASFLLASIYADHLNQLDKALEAAKAARNNAPDDPGIAHLLGRLALRQQNWTWAATLLQEASRNLPNDPAVAYDFAWASYYIGKVADATNTMRSAAGASGFAQAQAARRFLQYVSGSATPAVAASLADQAAQVLKAEPDYLPALMVIALNEQGKQNYTKAADIYGAILNRWPAFSPATRDLAVLSYEHLANEQRAYELAVKARPLFPTDAHLARTLGILSIKRGENPRGVQILKEAAQTRTTDAELFYYLGLGQKALKSSIDSRNSLQQAVKLGLAPDLAAKATQILAEK